MKKKRTVSHTGFATKPKQAPPPKLTSTNVIQRWMSEIGPTKVALRMSLQFALNSKEALTKASEDVVRTLRIAGHAEKALEVEQGTTHVLKEVDETINRLDETLRRLS